MQNFLLLFGEMMVLVPATRCLLAELDSANLEIRSLRSALLSVGRAPLILGGPDDVFRLEECEVPSEEG